ncbi:phosphodiester glycosidase family protein [Streptomyces coffeae]|uniref:phosphodiester glycosidase family protein n=1 Tax=Streptomyces coffeae TaxID=621382 RepID=UPI0027DB8DC4|nr:phosphodiester glycosidase family protein [Streptomyces coffeae]
MAVVATVAVSAPAQAAPPVPDATWTTRTVAPGVQIRTGVLRETDAKPSWTVTVRAAGSAPVGGRSWADSTAGRLRAAGFVPRVERVDWPGYSDTPHGTLGWRVRVGSYGGQDEARSVSAKVAESGFDPVADWTGYDAQQPADRQSVHLAVIDPGAFTGTVEATHGSSVADRERTSSLAARLRSLVAVNGGFFVTSGADGVPGTTAGLSVHHGALDSMAVGSRAALVLADGGRRARIADLTSTVTARAGSSRYAVEGVNRVPGAVRNCGRPGGVPTERPRQDVTCTRADDLVAFTPRFRTDLPTGPGAQVVLDADGRVVAAGARGGTVPDGGSVLQGTGAAADWLTAEGRPGTRIALTETVRDTSGHQVRWDGDDSVVSAAPTLVEGGRIAVDAATEGTLDPRDPAFGYAWSNARQPRTMAGIDGRGRLLLATVDGRQPGVSAGFTLLEAARFMRSLGAREALNLDGGGSSAMAVDGALVNVPSDAAGERAVGDTVQVLP